MQIKQRRNKDTHFQEIKIHLTRVLKLTNQTETKYVLACIPETKNKKGESDAIL